METKKSNANKKYMRIKKEMIPTVRAFVIRAPTLEATSHLTIDILGGGQSATPQLG